MDLFLFIGEKHNDVHFQNSAKTRDDDTQNERKSIEKKMANGRVVSYIMPPVPKLEPAIPRRKKHPEFAYRHHEFMTCNGDMSRDLTDCSTDRARVTYTVNSIRRNRLFSSEHCPCNIAVNCIISSRRSMPVIENKVIGSFRIDSPEFAQYILKSFHEQHMQRYWTLMNDK